MLLYLEVRGMRAQVLAAQEPALQGLPLAVLSGRRVVDISREAAESRLRIGQELTPAALCGLGVRWRRDPGDAACGPLQEELRRRLQTVARGVMEDGIGAFGAELWQDADAAAAVAACRGIGWEVRAALERSVLGAKALLRGGGERRIPGGVLCEGPRAALPLAALDWLPAGIRRRLAALGLATVGDLQAAPAAEILMQAGGETGRRLCAFAARQEPQGYRPLPAAADLSWRRSFEEAACDSRTELARAVCDAVAALRAAAPAGLPAIGAVEVGLQCGGERIVRRRELLRPTRQRARLEAAGLGLALGMGRAEVRAFCLRLYPAREEAPQLAERGLFYVPPAQRRAPGGVAPPQLPPRELRLGFFDPYRREAAELR